MSAILENYEYRNDRNDATIKVQKYFDKFSVPVWRIIYKPDSPFFGNVFQIFSDGLKNKPSRFRVKHILSII